MSSDVFLLPLNHLWINAVLVVCNLTYGTVYLYWDVRFSTSFQIIISVLNVLLFYSAIFLHVLLQPLPNCFTSCITCICFALHFPSPLYLHHTYVLRCFPFVIGVFFLLFTGILTCLTHDANITWHDIWVCGERCHMEDATTQMKAI
jgi:hypothetical protein